MCLTPEEFQEERRAVLNQRRLKAKAAAYKEAIEKLCKSKAEAVEYADQAFLTVQDATDD